MYIADMYMRTGVIAQRVAQSGISANLCCGGVLFSDTFDPETDHECQVQRALTEEWPAATTTARSGSTPPSTGSTPPGRPVGWMAAYAGKRTWACTCISLRPARSMRGLQGRHNGLTPIQTLNQYGVWDTGHRGPLCLDHP